jgi:hypothetical protein
MYTWLDHSIYVGCVPEASSLACATRRDSHLTGVGIELGDRATRPSPSTVQATRHWSLVHRDGFVVTD